MEKKGLWMCFNFQINFGKECIGVTVVSRAHQFFKHIYFKVIIVMQDLHVQETQKISPVRELWFALSCLVSLVPSLRCANLLDRDGFSTTGLLARLPKLLRCWEQRQNVVLQVWTNLQKISCRYVIRLQSSVYTQFQFATHSPSAQQLSRSKNEYWMHFHFKW